MDLHSLILVHSLVIFMIVASLPEVRGQMTPSEKMSVLFPFEGIAEDAYCEEHSRVGILGG